MRNERREPKFERQASSKRPAHAPVGNKRSSSRRNTERDTRTHIYTERDREGHSEGETERDCREEKQGGEEEEEEDLYF